MLLAGVLSASTSAAQRGRNERARLATMADFDGGFQFCRIVFRNAPDGDGNGWGVDWPRADENLSVRLAELTRTSVSVDDTGQPKHVLVRLSDPTLFHL